MSGRRHNEFEFIPAAKTKIAAKGAADGRSVGYNGDMVHH
jgi:hypothetical protein